MSVMSKGTAVSILIVCFLSLLFLTSLPVRFVKASPAERTTGVRAGDRIKYGDFMALWDSEIPGDVAPPNLIEANNTLWVVNTVSNVSGTLVTYESRTSYRNGTENSRVAKIDVATGVGQGNLSFVAAGLVADNKVYTVGEYSSMRINMTLSRAYAGLTRETNLLNVTVTLIDFGEAYWSEFFWDKSTGVLVEQFTSYAKIDENGLLAMGSVEYEMVDNNIWIGVPDGVPPTAVAGLDQTVEFGASVDFDAGGSRDNMGIARFLWSFGDGASGNGMKVTHTYERAGAFNVTLTVEDAEGNSSVDAVIVTVKEGPSSQLPLWLTGITVFLVILAILWFLLRRK